MIQILNDMSYQIHFINKSNKLYNQFFININYNKNIINLFKFTRKTIVIYS